MNTSVFKPEEPVLPRLPPKPCQAPFRMCMECIEACVFRKPKFDNEFDLGLGKRKPIYVPFPQAVPPVPVIDRVNCLQLKSGKCKKSCVEACGDRHAIDFQQQSREVKYEVGAIIIATGFQGFDPTPMTQFGYGQYFNVYTALEVERLLNASGPTNGKVLLADGSTPRRVGILHCIDGRWPQLREGTALWARESRWQGRSNLSPVRGL